MTQEMKEKITSLALQGYTSKEIEKEVPGVSEGVISTFVNDLNKEGKENYNPEIYNQILMARNLRNKEIIDYDFVEDIVKMVEQGFTYLEIGLAYGKTELEIRDILSKVYNFKHSIYYDPEFYQKINQKQNRTIKNKFQEVYKRIKKLEQEGLILKSLESSTLVKRINSYQTVIDLVQEYIDYNGTISPQALSTKYGFEVATVRAILNGSLYREIAEPMLGEEKMKEIKMQSIQVSKDTLAKNSQLFDTIVRAEKDTLEKIESQKKTWIQMILTFRLSLNDVAILNDYPESKIYALKNILCSNNSKLEQNALDYLLDYYIPKIHPDTTEERKNVQTFQNTLAMLKKRNEVAYRTYAKRLSDQGYKNVCKKKISDYTYEDYTIVIDYILKYALYPEEVGLSKETLKKYANGERRNELEILWQYQERKEETLKNRI